LLRFASLRASRSCGNSPEVAEAQADAAADQATGTGTGTGEIVVTGSRIQRPNLEQSSPVTVIGEDEIELQQATSAEELLRELPGQVASLNQNVNNGGTGAAFINLRGLGSNRNLVLLDGGRVVPADLQGRTDLNIIPLALLERVDTFTGGASTVYGADAVAGVVNFITKRDFAGIDVDAGMGITERGDGAIHQAAVTIGANFEAIPTPILFFMVRAGLVLPRSARRRGFPRALTPAFLFRRATSIRGRSNSILKPVLSALASTPSTPTR
jgi:outer membrane cobalamin receptor